MPREKPIPKNPFRPGAGQQPVYLAGRTQEQDEFRAMLDQDPVTQNVIVTGLRGVGKTVLLDTLKPIAQQEGWLWTGNDLSESASLTEDRIARRLVVDLATLLGPMISVGEKPTRLGFRAASDQTARRLSFDDLWSVYEATAGLVYDKLQAVFEVVGDLVADADIRGIIFAYDEAQNLADHAAAHEYPLSLILDLFSYLQRKNFAKGFLIVLTGLPTLFPKLNEARTYTERMFHVIALDRLLETDARAAVTKPLEITKSTLKFAPDTIDRVVEMSGGYPYFIQFIGKEVFDAWIGKITDGLAPSVPMNEILEKLDQDFFAPRWGRATDRQQQFMHVIANLDTAEQEFSVSEIVGRSKEILRVGFSPSHATQILQALAERGLVYRDRRATYRFAVPLLARFIKRLPIDPSAKKG